jgi:hypothetical protein
MPYHIFMYLLLCCFAVARIQLSKFWGIQILRRVVSQLGYIGLPMRCMKPLDYHILSSAYVEAWACEKSLEYPSLEF